MHSVFELLVVWVAELVVGSPGGVSPPGPTEPYVTVSRHTALVVLVLALAGVTQVQ